MANQRSRRVTLPGVDEMFFRSSGSTESELAQPTSHQDPPSDQSADQTATAASAAAASHAPSRGSRRARVAPTRTPEPSGRQRHDEKITVYVSAPELIALEQTRLALRADYGLTVDRGRIVREAVGVLLADFAENGEASMLVRGLLDD